MSARLDRIFSKETSNRGPLSELCKELCVCCVCMLMSVFLDSDLLCTMRQFLFQPWVHPLAGLAEQTDAGIPFPFPVCWDYRQPSWPLCGFWWWEFWLSLLHRKDLTCLAIFPAPKIHKELNIKISNLLIDIWVRAHTKHWSMPLVK